MQGFSEIARFEEKAEARGFEFTLRNVGLQARAFHVWEGQGDTPGWTWVVLVPDLQAARARQILGEERGEEPVAAPAPVKAGKPGAATRLYWVIGLAVACLLVWLAMEGSGGSETRQTLMRFGASHAPSVLGGQVWRTVTAVMLHIGFKHLLGNMASLLLFGIPVVQRWGAGQFYALFLGTGVAGNWISLALSPTEAIKAGASGGILGLLGALAGARIREIRRPSRSRPSRFKTWHVVAMLVAYYGFMVGVGPVDHLAHLGGLFAGLGVALVLPGLGERDARTERRLTWATGISAVALAAISGGLQALFG